MTSDHASEHLQMVEDCENREARLSEWEREFIDSVRHQLQGGRALSAKQTEVLDRIWEKATARG